MVERNGDGFFAAGTALAEGFADVDEGGVLAVVELPLDDELAAAAAEGGGHAGDGGGEQFVGTMAEGVEAGAVLVDLTRTVVFRRGGAVVLTGGHFFKKTIFVCCFSD